MFALLLSIEADIATVRDMVLRRQVEPERWERRFSSAEIEFDLDETEITATVQSADRNLRMRFRDPADRVAVLHEMAVAQFGRLTNAGDILFARTPDIRYPQVRVRAVCFACGKADDIYRDDQTFSGPAVRMLNETYRFILRNTPTTAHFRKGDLARRNESLYPPEAIREGLVNAFAHRDYADYKGGAVHVYPERLEICNSCAFPEGVTPDSLMKGHISVLRNPDIAHVLYLRGMMEKIGRGSLLIQDACKEHGLPPPEWSSDRNKGVRLIFYAPANEGKTQQVGQQATQQATRQVSQQVLRLIGVLDGDMSRTELMAALRLKDRVNFARRYLEPAMEQGILEMTQPDSPNSPSQRYRLTAKGQAS